MKNLTYLLILGLGLVVACAPEENVELIEKASDEIRVTLNLSGDIVSFDEEDISGGRVAMDDDLTYYLLNIRETGTFGNSHAVGVFDRLPDTTSVILFADRLYDVDVYAFRKGETFGIFVQNDSLINLGDQVVVNNRFVYNELQFDFCCSYGYYTSADSSTFEFGDTRNNLLIETFFGELDIDTSAPFDSTFDVNLLRNVFGFDIQTAGFTEGALEVLVLNEFIDLQPTDPPFSAVRSYSRGDLISDPLETGRSMRLRVIYEDTIANLTRSTELYNEFIPFNRLKRKQIFIELEADTTQTSPGTRFNITLDDEPLVLGDSLFIGG